MKKQLKPLAGYVLILPLDEEDQKTSSGLILPEKAKEKPMKGKIIAVGSPISHYEGNPIIQYENRNNNPKTFYPTEECQVKKGDTVIFYRWGTQTIQDGQKEYLLVKFADIQAVYE